MTGISDSVESDAAGRLEDVEREFKYEKKHFLQIAERLHAYAGIALSEKKYAMVYGRLARRLRQLGHKDFEEYCAFLESREGESEIHTLVNALTTNVTKFFRESHHFQHLGRVLIPQLQKNLRRTRRMRVWSAGCSSGQEPYTIAMTLIKNITDLGGWDARILATDVDRNMLQQGKDGVYGEEDVKGLPPDILDTYFQKLRAPDADRYQVKQHVQKLISFKYLNLKEPWPMKGPFDAIFCRNVMIYFDREMRQKTVENFARLLQPGGYLYLGHSENLFGMSGIFESEGQTIYRKI